MSEACFNELWEEIVAVLCRLGSAAWVEAEIRPRRYALRVKIRQGAQLLLFD